MGPRCLWLWLFLLFQTAGWVSGVWDDSPCRRGAGGKNNRERTEKGSPFCPQGCGSQPYTGQLTACPSGLRSHFMGWFLRVPPTQCPGAHPRTQKLQHPCLYTRATRGMFYSLEVSGSVQSILEGKSIYKGVHTRRWGPLGSSWKSRIDREAFSISSSPYDFICSFPL